MTMTAPKGSQMGKASPPASVVTAGTSEIRELLTRNMRTSGIYVALVALVALFGVLTGGALIGEAETILSFIFNNVIGRLLVFLFIVIIIRVVPRGIFGYYERR